MRRTKDINRLRGFLLEGSKSWGELLKLTSWSPSVLKNRIDYLEKIGELTSEVGKKKGRRTTLYKLVNRERSEANLERYYAIKFIEGINDPVYGFQLSKNTKVSTSVFISSVEDPRARKVMQTIAVNTAKEWMRFAKLLSLKTREGLKVAVILTKES